MATYRVVFEIANRCSTLVNAPTEALAQAKVRDALLGDEMPGEANPQPKLQREIKHIKNRRVIVSVTEIP
jgi:hypothetical protein